MSRVGSLVTLFHLGAEQHAAPQNFTEAKQLDTARFAATHADLLSAGQYLPASQFEALFASTTHDAEMLDALGEALRVALAQPVEVA